MTTQRILILGSTGSIGTQALEVIADNPDKFEVVGIAAGGSNPQQIIEQARSFHLSFDHIAVAQPAAAAEVSAALGGTVLSGDGAAEELVRSVPADTVLNALVGSLGLKATLATLDMGEYLSLIHI